MTEQQLRERVRNFWQLNFLKGKAFTVNHFVNEGCARSTIYTLLSNLSKSSNVHRKPGSGGHNKKLTNQQRASIRRWIQTKRGVSLRREASKYGVCATTMRNIIKEGGLKCRKRKKAPQYTEEQVKRVKLRAGKLLRSLSDKKIIMDDESYFKLKCDYLPGNDHYFTSSPQSAPEHVKYRTERKFPVQLMVWLCVSADHISDPIFLQRPNSVHADFYQEQCIRQGLMKFIKKYHRDDEILFWPDLDSTHYANSTLKLLHHLNIPIIDKECIPPNVPHCRPIENFWGALKAKVYEGGWEAQTIPQLQQRIKKMLKTMDQSTLRKDFKGIKKRLRAVYRDGPLSIIL